jgi:hypothetical protein
MTNFLGKPSALGIRWVARIMGTLLGLLLLTEFIEWLTGTRPPASLRDYLIAVGWLLIISGFVVGWFKELAASLLVLGGIALVSVIRLLPPGGEWPWPIFIVAAILSFLFLYVHLASKKKIVPPRSAQS